MSSDGDVDYSRYSLQQLQEARRSIDPARFPLHFERLNLRIQELQSMPASSPPDTYSTGSTTFIIRRLKTGSVFRLVAAGTFFSLVPFCTLLGLLALFGSEYIKLNEEPVVGLKGLIVSPFVGIFFAVIVTALFGVMLAFGLWVYSQWKPLALDFVPAERSNDEGAT